jgi:hypothetical protein
MLKLLRDSCAADAVGLLEERTRNGMRSPLTLLVLAEAQFQAGRPDDSVATAKRMMDGSTRSVVILRIASLLARSSGSSDDAAKKATYAIEAVGLLLQLQQLGTLSIQDLQHEDFNSLRRRDDFRALAPNPKARPLVPRIELRPRLAEPVAPVPLEAR